MIRLRNAFTLIELLAVIAIIGVLVALGLPAVLAARQASLKVECANHQWQIGRAFHQRISVFNKTPTAKVVANELGSYMENQDATFTCPSLEDPLGVSYAVNKRVQRIKIGDSNMKIVLVDANEPLVDLVSNSDEWKQIVEPRHLGSLNVLYYDGHIESKLLADLETYVVLNPATTPKTEAQAQAEAEQIAEDVRAGRRIFGLECPITGRKVEAAYPINIAGTSISVCCSVCQKKILDASPAERIRMVFSNEHGVWVSR